MEQGSEMVSDDIRSLNDLPHPFGPLIGRDGEVAEILNLLPTARLLTLTGTGGSGKTRLAAQAAAESQSAFPDGVRWVDLGAVAGPALVPHVVAARCGIVDRGGAPVFDALVTALRPRRVLLVLDNCEHLLSECAHVTEALLAKCHDLHILAVSREALALPGEVIWHVAPLRVPESDAVASVDDLLTFDAVALFVTRATEAVPAFRLTEENAASVIRICRRVGGLPLALEMAASRLRVLTPAELAERLDVALHVLTRGSRTAAPRHQSMRATLDWSYQLLPDTERAVFGRLSVFAGSFCLEGAERVCVGPGIAEGDVLDLVSRLVEKSLVGVHDRGEETRYRLLEPIRQYARERLVESGEADQTEQQLRDWSEDLAEKASAGLSGPEQNHWLDRLETEHDNLSAAILWSLAHEDAEGAGRIAAGIWQYLLLRGHLHEGSGWLGQIVAALPDPTSLRAHLLWVGGILARPDAALGRRRFEESLAIWQALGDQDGAARVLGSLGFTAQDLGEHDRAVAYLEQSLSLSRVSNDASTLARVLTGLALSVLEAGDVERATILCREGLELFQQMDDLHGVAAATANLGLIRRASGDQRGAAELWEESLAVRRRIGDRGGEAHVLTLLGSLACGKRNYTQATAFYLEGLTLRARMRDEHGAMPILEGLAAVGAAQDDLMVAAQLAGYAAALREASGIPLQAREQSEYERTVATLRARLDLETFTQAWNEGRVFSLEEHRQWPGHCASPTGMPTPHPPTNRYPKSNRHRSRPFP